ncbi:MULTISPECIES: ABC transporter substrate-binding protein [unclassified Sphingomonas]|uniref:ABC transporter substrate-binding protein n=1 Tax=unclassified Sphingomonas TaxID=196159 RepID=UPI0021506FB2|nr:MULTISPECIES: ABC transporter substrate-binding protein [unclassified Sphingomonas]MCR5871902.1 ABC transporter substrate-binding protein [Sphingomonas sp. J344]UUY01333.1 ABC transporter substrate-binding protein [Sphingomonas sp. J315]
MRRAGIALAIAGMTLPVSAGSAPPPVAGAKPALPMRVMSINQCTDQLVLMLLPPERIASVTWLSRDPLLSLMSARARGIAVNRGEIEDVVRQQPDLIVADSFGSAATRAALRRFGFPMIEVAQPQSLDEIRATVRALAARLGTVARGEALIAGMDARLAELSRRPALNLRVASWSGDGLSRGEGALYDAVLDAAGARNAAKEGVAGTDVEALLALNPDILVAPVGGVVGQSLRDRVARHPLVRKQWAGRQVGVSPRAYICGTPLIAEAAAELRGQLETANRQRATR